MHKDKLDIKAVVSDLSEDDFSRLLQAVRERQCREEFGFGTIEEAAKLFSFTPACPSCGCTQIVKNGFTRTGKQRYKCSQCGTRFNVTSSTVLDYCKKDLPTWLEFIRLMNRGVALETSAQLCRVSVVTAFEWRRRVLAAASAAQASLRLSGKIWYGHISAPKVSLDHEMSIGERKQGTHIVFAFDDHDEAIAISIDGGTVNTRTFVSVLGSHVMPGSKLLTASKRPSRSLERELACSSELYDPNDTLGEGREYAQRLRSFVAKLRGTLGRGGERSDTLQSRLDWFCFTLKLSKDPGSTASVRQIVERLFTESASYRRVLGK